MEYNKEGDQLIDQYGNEITWVPNLNEKKGPLYISIANCIEEDIKKGILTGGFKLPPQRVIANHLGINHSTVTRAYKLCEEKGLIRGVTGKGTFVTSYAGIPQNLLTNSNDLNIIEMGTILPLYELNDLIETFIKEIYQNIDFNEVLRYVPPEGHIRHRYIASTWLKNFNIDYSSEEIIITSGSQNALAIILTSLFKKGERIIVDEYTYTGLLSLAKLLGIILVPVKTNEDGIDIDELNTACDRENVKGIYLIPDCHNPTTAILNQEKRIAIGDIIKRHDLLLIEDSPFIFTVQDSLRPISQFVKENSIFIAGTSKSVNPSFRISYIASPKKYVKELIHGVNSLTWMASPLNAEILSHILSTSKYNEIINSKLSILKNRNKIVDEILGDYHLVPSDTSLFRYLILPSTISDQDIELACFKKGVQVFSAKRFIVGTHPNQNAIRLSVSGPSNTDELKKGLSSIKDVLELSKSDINPII